MTEADAGLPETTEQALVLSKERLAARTAPTQVEPPVEVEQPTEAQAAAGAEAGTKPIGQSEAGAKADFSFVADPALRTALEKANLDAGTREKFKAWTTDYTQKTQRASEYERKAQAWEALEGIPGAKKAIAQLLASAESGGEPEPDEVLPDLTTMDNKDIVAFIRAEAKRLARDEAESTLRQRVLEPATRKDQILSVPAGMFKEWKDVLPRDEFIKVWEESVAYYGEDQFTPENAGRLFQPFLDKAVLAREVAGFKAKQSKDAAVAQRATSPAGSSIVSAGAKEPETAKPTGKPEDARKRTKAELLERFGWSERDLEQAART